MAQAEPVNPYAQMEQQPSDQLFSPNDQEEEYKPQEVEQQPSDNPYAAAQ